VHGTHIEQAKQDDVHENRNQSVNTQSTDTATETGIDDKIYCYNNNENNSNNDKIMLMLSAFATNYYLIPTFNGCFSIFLRAGCPSFQPTIGVKTVKATQTTLPNQWPGLILSTSATELLAEWTLLCLYQLLEASSI